MKSGNRAASEPARDSTIDALRGALTSDPDDVRSLALLVRALLAAGRSREAVARARQLTRLRPAEPWAQLELGRVLAQTGEAREARVTFERALVLDPRSAVAHVELGNLLARSDSIEEAGRHFDLACSLDPLWSVPRANRGALAFELGRLDEAAVRYREALSLNPDDAEAGNGLGSVLLAEGRFDDAVVQLRHAADRTPDHVVTRLNLGRALRAVGDFEQAIVIHRALVDAHPVFAEAWDELAQDHWAAEDFEGALDAARRSVSADPRRALSQVSLGNILADLNDLPAAIRAYRQALRLSPGLAIARWNLSLAELTACDFKRGWDDYEARWLCREFPSPRRSFDVPLLAPAQNVAGRTILIHAEQGFGDTIQFMRFVPALVARGASVVFEVQPPLVTLVGEGEGMGRVIARGDDLPAFDFHAPLLSLPRVLGAYEPDGSMVPYVRPHAKPRGVGARRRVGIVWSGNSGYRVARGRSLRLDQIASWFDIETVEWVGLQKTMIAEERSLAASLADRAPRLVDGLAFADFAETADAIASLDLVISVDTAVAHLAGAMNKPLWILLQHAADFRWQLARDDSPWYPSARLFRCPGPGAWVDVIGRVRDALSR